jgi:hypothetical protein
MRWSIAPSDEIVVVWIPDEIVVVWIPVSGFLCIPPSDEIVGVSCIWLVFVCSGDERFRWTVSQSCRYAPSKCSTRHECDYDRTCGWVSSAILRIRGSILTLVSGQVRLTSRPPGCL